LFIKFYTFQLNFSLVIPSGAFGKKVKNRLDQMKRKSKNKSIWFKRNIEFPDNWFIQ